MNAGYQPRPAGSAVPTHGIAPSTCYASPHQQHLTTPQTSANNQAGACLGLPVQRREPVELHPEAAPPTDEIGYYAASLAPDQVDDAGLLQAIRGH